MFDLAPACQRAGGGRLEQRAVTSLLTGGQQAATGLLEQAGRAGARVHGDGADRRAGLAAAAVQLQREEQVGLLGVSVDLPAFVRRRGSAAAPATTAARRAPRCSIRRAGEDVGRDRVKRLMRTNGIQGAKRRGKRWRTTIADPAASRSPDLVNRDLSAQRPDSLWRADLTYPRCWEGVVFFSFVIDAFSSRIVGWQFAGHMRTDLVADALRMALTRRQHGADVEPVHHSDAGSQHTSHAFGQLVDDHAVLGSIGSVGDAYDNLIAESFVDGFKTELIRDRVWRTRSQLELAIVEHVGWFNNDRLHESLGDLPPAEHEALYAPTNQTITHTICSWETTKPGLLLDTTRVRCS